MSIAFNQSMLSLRSDGHGRTLAVLLAAALVLTVWLAWFLLARVPVYEVSDVARVEASDAAHAVEAPVDGRVIATHLALGESVERGEVLIELDASALRLQQQEARARLAGITAQLGPMAAQIAAQERALLERREASHAKVREADARVREAQVVAQQAGREAASTQQLGERGYASAAEVAEVQSRERERSAAANASRRALERAEAERRADETGLEAEIARLNQQKAQLEGQQAAETASLEVLAKQIDERTIRAPVTGRLGEIASLQPGSVVHAGDRLGAIVPSGELKVVAGFQPGHALGRLRPGQPARVRLEGFPWSQYGTVAAVVSSVGSEVRDGRVRVELHLPPNGRPSIPLQHGLPGMVEVDVDRASPAVLVLRAAGQRLGGRSGEAR